MANEVQAAQSTPVKGDLAAHKAALVTPDSGGGVGTWHTVNFATAADAVSYAGIPPVQGPGEFVVTDDPNGGFDGFYYF